MSADRKDDELPENDADFKAMPDFIKTALPDFGTKAATVRDTAIAHRKESQPVTLKHMIFEMRAKGILPPGKRPRAKHFETLAALKNAEVSARRADMMSKDLAAIEAIGGMGGLIVATMTDPKAKATQKQGALQQVGNLYRLAPQLVNGQYAKQGEEDNIFSLSPDELRAIQRELGDMDEEDGE
jgi:hypothetical protein